MAVLLGGLTSQQHSLLLQVLFHVVHVRNEFCGEIRRSMCPMLFFGSVTFSVTRCFPRSHSLWQCMLLGNLTALFSSVATDVAWFIRLGRIFASRRSWHSGITCVCFIPLALFAKKKDRQTNK